MRSFQFSVPSQSSRCFKLLEVASSYFCSEDLSDDEVVKKISSLYTHKIDRIEQAKFPFALLPINRYSNGNIVGRFGCAYHQK